MHRRDFLRMAGGLTASLLVVGCGDGGDDFVFTDNNPQGPAPQNPLGRLVPRGVIEALDDGRLIELQPNLVSVFDASGTLLFSISEATLPSAAASDETGRIFVLDRGTGRVVVLGAQGGVEGTFGQDLQPIIDLAVSNGEVFLLNPVELKIDVFSTEGVFARTFGVGPERAHLRAIAAGPTGNLHVLISNPVSVAVVSPGGQLLSSYAPPAGVARSARGLAVNGSGRSAILDHVGFQVLVFDESQEFVSAVTIPDADGNLSQPITVGLGPDGQLHASFTEVLG